MTIDTASSDWLVIGADGGGTHLRVKARFGAREATHEGPGVNAARDPAGAAAALLAGVERLRAELGAAGAPVALHAGLAGAMDRALGRAVAERLPLAAVRVEEDRDIALRGALGTRDGAVVGLGTGSFVAHRLNGETRLVGGWGFAVADQASGAWLGRELLRRAVLHMDGVARGERTVATVADGFGSPLAVSLWAEAASPADFARYAPRVVEGMRRGEADMAVLMREGASYVEAALAAVGWRGTTPLVVMGGLAAATVPFLRTPYRKALTEPDGSALDGALAAAGELADAGRALAATA